jgi:hypothetical protein
VDRVLCRCDNKDCGLELTILPHGLGNCPQCGRGRLRPKEPLHPLAYAPYKQERIFSESYIKKYFEEGMKLLEASLQAEVEMDKYEPDES